MGVLELGAPTIEGLYWGPGVLDAPNTTGLNSKSNELLIWNMQSPPSSGGP